MKKLTDGRKPVLRSLPPLAEACPDFPGFKKGDNRTERLFEVLMVLIQRCRRSTPLPFYAMRDVATFFKVSLNTASRVYRRLDREGVLTRVRSSQSIIAARAPRPRFAVRGVVCMPIWTPGFLSFLDWRRWFSQLEEELSRYRFILEPIFYKADEERHPAFVDRVLKFNPDYVLWNWPNFTDRMTMQSIADTGVPVVTIQNTDHQFPGRAYLTSYDLGMQRGLKEWERSGEIQRIVIPQQEGLVKDVTSWSIKPSLQACGLPHRFEILTSEKKRPLADYLQGLAPNRGTGVIFNDHILYARVCTLEPKAMLELFRQHRVMVMRQVALPLRISRPPSDLMVDALLFPWKKLARQIATDLNTSKGSLPSARTILEAEWRPQIPLASMVQTVCEE